MALLRLTALFRLAALLCAVFAVTPLHGEGVPDWVLSAPQLGDPLQAVGTGNSISAARLNAVGELLSSISSHISVQQQLTLRKADTTSESLFHQSTSAASLPLDVEGIEVIQSFSAPDLHAVQIAVPRGALLQAVDDQLGAIGALGFPRTGAPQEQLLWALQYRDALKVGLRYIRIAAVLENPRPEIRDHLQTQAALADEAIQRANVRIIAGQDLEFLKAILSEQFSAAADDLLWLRVSQRRFTARQGTRHSEKRVLRFELTDSAPPFKSYITRDLTATGTGDTPQAARIDVQDNIAALARQRLSSWFFSNVAY